ncbi:MAG: pyridoxamine 5'-phosphate oxidase family protein [Phormidesmis sp. RL_2_1]|nr:pyridoxamine 5'-phosphate oxidase family protein [Phormidesmis sp. RL_2_1]
MAKQYQQITAAHRTFIEQQKIFFVGTAGCEGRVNVSPKGMDSLRVLGPHRVVWLSVTGSGNESAAHVGENGRMTVMFCSFAGAPMILRLYGEAQVVYPRDAAWLALKGQFPDMPGTRQFFDLSVSLVQTSCGMAVPLYEYEGDRTALNQWAEQKGPDGIETYWREKNQVSIDGLPTCIF